MEKFFDLPFLVVDGFYGNHPPSELNHMGGHSAGPTAAQLTACLLVGELHTFRGQRSSVLVVVV
jgi:hypothetical protein